MSTLYQEKIITCGGWTEVDVYPVLPPQKGRGKKAKPTSQVQKELNERYAKKRIGYLVNTNFTEDDIRLDLTYDSDHLPQSPEDAQHQVQLFIRRLINYCRKRGLPERKYIYVTEVGSKSGRVHHHIITNGDVSAKTLAAIWGKGYTTVKPLQFDKEYGCTALAEYMTKKPILGRRWNCSKNLKQPVIRTRQIAKAKAVDWRQRGFDARADIEARYGLKCADVKPFFNGENGGSYIAISLYDPDAISSGSRKKKEGRRVRKDKMPGRAQ